MFNKDSSRTVFYIAGFVLTRVGQSGLCVCGGERCVWRGGGGVGAVRQTIDIKKKTKKWLDVRNLPAKRTASLWLLTAVDSSMYMCDTDAADTGAVSLDSITADTLSTSECDGSLCECDQLSDVPLSQHH